MKRLIYLSILSITYFFGYSQKNCVSNFNYVFTVIKNNDTTYFEKVIKIDNYKIIDILVKDSFIASEYDFQKDIHTINNPKYFSSKDFNISENRFLIKNLEEIGNNKLKIVAFEKNIMNDTIYLDKSIKIPCYKKGGYLDYLDNGLGYLPIELIRHYYSERDNCYVKVVAKLK